MTRKIIKKEYLDSLEKILTKSSRRKIELSRRWSKDFPNEAGVYVFFEDNKLVYVGETSSIKERMKDVLDTRHHTLRRKIGRYNFSKNVNYRDANSKNKFHPTIEKLVDKHVVNKMNMFFLVVDLGRKELEEYISKKHNPKYNNVYVRGTKK